MTEADFVAIFVDEGFTVTEALSVWIERPPEVVVDSDSARIMAKYLIGLFREIRGLKEQLGI